MNEDQPTAAAAAEQTPEQELDKATDEAIAEKPAGPFYTLLVHWADGTEEEERERVFTEHLAELAREVGASPEDHLPACVEAVTIQRITD